MKQLKYVKNLKSRLFRKKERGITVFAPNHKFYLVLLLIAVIITILAFFVENNKSAFAIWISISCGAVASIIVAWLIDEANCRQAEEVAKENRETLFKRLFSTFENSLQILIYEYLVYTKDNSSKKWFEWTQCAYDQITEQPEFRTEYNRSMYLFFEGIYAQGVIIQAQEASLLKAGIVMKEDIEALSSMISVCDLAKRKYDSKIEEEELAKFNNTFCNLLRNIIRYSPAMKKINEKCFESTLFQMMQKTKMEDIQSSRQVDNE